MKTNLFFSANTDVQKFVGSDDEIKSIYQYKEISKA